MRRIKDNKHVSRITHLVEEDHNFDEDEQE